MNQKNQQSFLKSQLINASLRFLGYRSRSQQEIIQYLQQRTADQDLVDQIINYLKELKLIDDQAFASQYASSLVRSKLKGPKYIQQKLQHLGVSQSDIQQAINSLSPKIQLKSALKFLHKKNRYIFKYPVHQQKLKASQYLYNQGFSGSILQQAIDEYFIDE